jgi:tetratricopeptide (TPR) repeat protein
MGNKYSKRLLFKIFIISFIVIALLFCLTIYRLNEKSKHQYDEKENNLNALFKTLDTTVWKNEKRNFQLINNAIHIANKTRNKYVLTKLIFHKARYYEVYNKWDSSLYYYSQALKMANFFKDDTLIVRINNGIANYYINYKENYNKAIYHLSEALKISEHLGNNKYTGLVENGLGLVYLSQKDYDNAIQYFKKAIKISNDFGETRNKGITNMNLGCCYMGKNELNNSLYYYENALKLLKKTDDSSTISSVFINIGNIYKEQNRVSDAFNYYNKALKYIKPEKDSKLVNIIFHNIGLLYINSNNIQLAKKYLLQSLDSFSKIRCRSAEMQAYLSLSGFEEKEGNWKQAHEYYKKYAGIKDSLTDGDIRKKISEFKWKYDFQKKKYEADLFNKKYETKRNQNIILIITFITFVLFVVLLGRNIQLIQRKMKETMKLQEIENERIREKMEAEKRINELEMLRHQSEIEIKNRELTTVSLQLITKNEILSEISELSERRNKENNHHEPVLDDLKKILKQNLNQEEDWKHFKTLFEDVHQKFFVKLKQLCPKLSESELRLCAYIRINLQNKEIANLLNITSASVITSRYRIRKKLNLENHVNLDDFIRNI